LDRGQGHIVDVHSETPAVDLKEPLHYFLPEDLRALNRYEDTSGLAAWDARKRQGWAVNDQTSMLNLYHGEYDAGLYGSTNAFSLARALGLGLDPCGAQEFLARNYAGVLAPTTMFAGLRRVNIGERVRYRAGTLSRGKRWHWYEPEASYRSTREPADTAAAVAVERVPCHAASASLVLSDLLGGLDSRLVASAACTAGLD
jgi:asparagine synthetase B (glutamine-hydrolysing)